MIQWTVTVNIKNDRNENVTSIKHENKYFDTMKDANTWGEKKGQEYIEETKNRSLWYTVDVE